MRKFQSTRTTAAKKALFESLTLTYINELYSTALRLTKSEKDAEDLMQDTYLKAYTYFYQFKQGTNCRAWLFKILTNTFINNYRRKIKERSLIEQEKNQLGETFVTGRSVEWLANPEYQLTHNGLSDEVQRALSELPTDFRTVVILSDLQGFSYREIAEFIGTPIGTVMSRLFRGRRSLREKLQQYAVQEGIIKPPEELEEQVEFVELKKAANG